MKCIKLEVLLVFLMLIIFMGSVSASENVSLNYNVGDESGNSALSQNIIADNTLSADEEPGSFVELESLIENSTTGVVDLPKDYRYRQDIHSEYSRGIEISDITINGNGHYIDGNNIAKMFRIAGGTVILNNITFINGYGNSHLPNGGAIHMDGGTLILNNCTFVNNTAMGHGGAIGVYNYKSKNTRVEVYDSVFENNTALKDGGAIYSYDVLVDNTLFYRNQVAADLNSHTMDVALGGAIATSKGVVRKSNFTGNVVENIGEKQINDGGGAIFARELLSVYDSHFENNTSHKGGAIFMYIESADHSLLVPTRNLTVNNTKFIHNVAFNGGAICSNFNITVNNSVFDYNHADGYGGGAINTGFRSNNNIIENSNFTGNVADNYGGALATSHSHIKNCEFVNNSARHGGAIYSLRFTIEHSVLRDNHASEGNNIIVIDGYTKDDYTIIPPEDILIYVEGDVNDYSADVLDNAGHDNDMIHSGPYEGYQVYCIEKFLDYPDNTEGLISDDLSYITNALDHQVVTDYIKIMFYLMDAYPDRYASYIEDHSHVQYSVHQFTDYDYTKSKDQLVSDVMALYASGFRIPGNVYQLPNGSFMSFDMLVFLTPVDRQNMVLFKSSPFTQDNNGTVDKETLNQTVCIGDDVQFRITVTNVGEFDLVNVFINDTQYDEGLIYKDWIAEKGNWTYNENSKLWFLDDYLKPKQSASIIVIFKTNKTGKLINNVTFGNGNIVLDNSSNHTNVYNASLEIQKIALNKTVQVGEATGFIILVKNTGTINLKDITVYEQIPEGLNYVNHTNSDVWTKTGDVFKYKSDLAVNESINFTIWFIPKVIGEFVNTIVVSSNETSNKTTNNTTTAVKPQMTVEKVSNSKVVKINEEVGFTIIVRNIGNCDLTGVYIIDKDYSSGLEYDYYVDPSNKWTYEGNNKWTYQDVLKVNQSATLMLVFIAKQTGEMFNTVIAGNNMTNETVNSTNTTNVTKTKNNGTTPSDRNESNSTNNKTVTHKSNVYVDKRATGNPILMLLLVLITLGVIPKRRN